MSFILGKKMRMTQVWKDQAVTPVTLVKAEPNQVILVRTKDKDGYEAVQLSLGKSKREFRLKEDASYEKGQELTVADFQEGEKVKVSGLTKGRGFQGVVKRHGFAGGPKTHGQKNRLRHPGSIGSTAFQRVVPGRKMGGRMGQERVSVKNLIVAGVDTEKNILMIKGALPGAPGTLLEIRKIAKTKK